MFADKNAQNISEQDPAEANVQRTRLSEAPLVGRGKAPRKKTAINGEVKDKP